MKWAGGRNITWHACSKLVGGAERAGWETLLEMESVHPKGGVMISESATCSLGG